MKLPSGNITLLVAAILGAQHLSSGFPLGKDLTAAPKSLGDVVRRGPPIIRPEPEPEPVTGPTEPPPGSEPPGSAPPGGAPHFGGDPAPPANPASPADPPPRFGGDPAPVPEPAPAPPAPPAPKVATLGTEDELVAAGLKQGTPERTAFDRFVDWFNNVKATQTETPWIFYTKLGEEATQPGRGELVFKFQDAFKQGNFRQPGDEPVTPSDRIQNMGEVMNPSDLPAQVGEAPPRIDSWYDMIASYGAARLAAVRGGNVRILMPKDVPDTPVGRYWTDFEAFELTKPGSNVQSIWRYNSADFNEPPTQMWTKGMPPIGNQARFDAPPAEAAEDDGLIDLDM